MLPDFEVCRNEYRKYSIELTDEMYKKFDLYADFLVEYNKNINLTAYLRQNRYAVFYNRHIGVFTFSFVR